MHVPLLFTNLTIIMNDLKISIENVFVKLTEMESFKHD